MSRFLSVLALTAAAVGCTPAHTTSADLGGTSSDLADDRLHAVQQTLANRSECSMLPNFYWEIGDKSGALASGSVGSLFSASTQMNIASASKLVWGAYVVERFKSSLAMIDFPAMSMQTGYTSLVYASCVGTATVTDCFNAGNNAKLDNAQVGRFYYNGGHFQKYAIDLGLGAADNAALAAEMKKYLGAELDIGYSSPQLAAGVQMTPAAYAVFLRKVLANKLAIHDQLGARAVCTLPAACATATYSPATYAWHYSYAHWVEDEPTTGDGAFSSPGAFGFYPWIDASKTYYGILARYSLTPQAYLESAACGRLLRAAFLSGKPQ